MKNNVKEARFIEQYLLDGDATKAAIRAGYSRKSAHVTGCKLLKKNKAEIDAKKAIMASALRREIGVTRERIIKELGYIGFADAADFFDVHGNPIDIPALRPRARRALAGFECVEDFLGVKQKDGTTKAEPSGYTKKYKLADKIKALGLMCELLGFKRDRAVDDDMTLEELVLGSFEVDSDEHAQSQPRGKV